MLGISQSDRTVPEEVTFEATEATDLVMSCWIPRVVPLGGVKIYSSRSSEIWRTSAGMSGGDLLRALLRFEEFGEVCYLVGELFYGGIAFGYVAIVRHRRIQKVGHLIR